MDANAARVDAEGRRGCGETPGDYVDVVVTEPQGRLYVVWERQGGEHPYTELAVAHPPRVFVWHADEYGCWMSIGVVGTREYGCPVGPPPPPPSVAWGKLLP